MFKLKTIVVSLAAVFSATGCALLNGSADGQRAGVRPDVSVSQGAGDDESMYHLARYYQSVGQTERALTTYRTILQRNPRFADARNGLAVLHAMQGQHDDATRELRAAIEAAPLMGYLHHNLGYLYLKRAMNREAADALAEAVRLDPDNRQAQQNLQLARSRMGAAPQAEVKAPAAVTAPAARVPGPEAAVRSGPDAGVQLVNISPQIFELRAPTATFRLPIQQPAAQATVLAPPANPAPVRTYRLEVANGNGATGLAKRVSQQLGEKDVRTVRLTNQVPAVAATEIQYRDGYAGEAARLAGALKSQPLVVRNDQLRGDIHVRLVIGRDVASEVALFEPVPVRNATLVASTRQLP
jgi:tetratricopeptide (TPR) repeat protein